MGADSSDTLDLGLSGNTKAARSDLEVGLKATADGNGSRHGGTSRAGRADRPAQGRPSALDPLGTRSGRSEKPIAVGAPAPNALGIGHAGELIAGAENRHASLENDVFLRRSRATDGPPVDGAEVGRQAPELPEIAAPPAGYVDIL